MEKKNRLNRFTFNRRSILVLLILFILTGTVIVVIADQKGIAKGKGEPAFQVKIPDGLYLYKADITELIMRPLVLVKNV